MKTRIGLCLTLGFAFLYACGGAGGGAADAGDRGSGGDLAAEVAQDVAALADVAPDAATDADSTSTSQPDTTATDEASPPDVPPADDAPATDAAGTDDSPATDAGTDAEGDAIGPPTLTCCAYQDNCADGEVCVVPYGAVEGVCLPPPASGSCWTRDDCGQGPDADPAWILHGNCLGTVLCGCGVTCASPVQPGACALTEDLCCVESAMCEGPEDRCVGVTATSFGRCMPPLAAGACYEDADCPDLGSFCEGMTVCACGESCAFQAGVCAYVPSTGCCAVDAGCLTGNCAIALPGENGVCKEDPAAGECWSDRDCPDGFCEGESVCPCDADCDAPDAPGHCVPLPTGCCTPGTDCGEGRVCVGWSGNLPGTCKTVPDILCPEGGCCWGWDDCGGNASCTGEAHCPCVAACPDCNLACPEDDLGTCTYGGDL